MMYTQGEESRPHQPRRVVRVLQHSGFNQLRDILGAVEGWETLESLLQRYCGKLLLLRVVCMLNMLAQIQMFDDGMLVGVSLLASGCPLL